MGAVWCKGVVLNGVELPRLGLMWLSQRLGGTVTVNGLCPGTMCLQRIALLRVARNLLLPPVSRCLLESFTGENLGSKLTLICTILIFTDFF